ncbi:unnamed protein product [Lactuca virosa]|uniref:Large ribosomal subunit protein uL10-like insertion domain-containing protein n=1 Tax=Lactuca virosa TaxID=75947 RepID=A0AAU9LVM5_9ASTR|nr:unnamed protein product [Lactuca virosa]
MSNYTQVLVYAANNVGSNQLQNIRHGLCGDSIMLIRKNTIMKCSIRMHSEKTRNKAYLNLINLLVENVGLIFTKEYLKEDSEEVSKYKVGAPARIGLMASVDVVIPPDNTGLDPSPTSFFQVLNIITKINKGKWKSSPLLSSSRRVIEKFALGVFMVTSLALAIHYPTIVDAPHINFATGAPTVVASSVGGALTATVVALVEEKKEVTVNESEDGKEQR